jgi:excisionase family DNA binding protein
MNEFKPSSAMTVREFCDAYRIGRTYFYNLLKSGRLSANKVGTKTIVLRTEAERWAASLPKLGTAIRDPL